MEEIQHQLRLVAHPIIYRIYRVLAPSQVVSRISSINRMVTKKMRHVSKEISFAAGVTFWDWMRRILGFFF